LHLWIGPPKTKTKKSALDSQQDLELGEREGKRREEKTHNQKPMWRKQKCICVSDLLNQTSKSAPVSQQDLELQNNTKASTKKWFISMICHSLINLYNLPLK
jgi:hypothetical protein